MRAYKWKGQLVMVAVFCVGTTLEVLYGESMPFSYELGAIVAITALFFRDKLRL